MAPLLKTFFQDFKTDQHGQIFLTGPLNVGEYSRAHLAIAQGQSHVPNIIVRTQMGKISGTTLAPYVDVFPLDAALKIHSYEVAGPEVSVVLTGGPPNANVSIQAWLFLH